MIRGIVIPHAETSPIEERTFDGLSDYQAAAGGWVEAIYIQDPPTTLFVNEEGKIRALPRNPRATALWWLLSPSVRWLDVIVGDAVLIGSSRGRGTTSDLPESLRALLMETSRYQVEMATQGGQWNRDNREFDSYFEAATYAVLQADRASAREARTRRVRVVAA